MNINGVNSLACITFASQVTTVGPLPNFPVLKDFVVDLRGFFKQYEYIRPFVRNVNLHRYHINSVFERYQSACRAIYGEDPERANLRLEAANKHPSETALTAALKLLDATVESGNVTHAVQILERLRALGLVLHGDKVIQLIEATLKNHASE